MPPHSCPSGLAVAGVSDKEGSQPTADAVACVFFFPQQRVSLCWGGGGGGFLQPNSGQDPPCASAKQTPCPSPDNSGRAGRAVVDGELLRSLPRGSSDGSRAGPCGGQGLRGCFRKEEGVARDLVKRDAVEGAGAEVEAERVEMKNQP